MMLWNCGTFFTTMVILMYRRGVRNSGGCNNSPMKTNTFPAFWRPAEPPVTWYMKGLVTALEKISSGTNPDLRFLHICLHLQSTFLVEVFWTAAFL